MQCTIYLPTYFLICMYTTPMAILRKLCWCSGIDESILHTENNLSMTCPQPLQWRHNEHDCVSNQRRLDCLLNRLFRRRSKKTSNLRATVLCERNPSVAGEFPAQSASNMEMLPFNDVIMITAISEKNEQEGPEKNGIIHNTFSNPFTWKLLFPLIQSSLILYGDIDTRVYAVNWCVSRWNGHDTMDVIFFFIPRPGGLTREKV